jgi:hypothetical protein
MAEFKQIPIFTWKDKSYSVKVKSSIYDNWQDYFENEEELYKALIEGLPLQKNEDGERKYPELTPRPNTHSKEYRDLDRAWWNERLREGGRLRMGEKPPSKTAVKEWSEANPGAEDFFTSMVRYGQGQGFTYGFGENIGLQDDIKAYKYFSNVYPFIAPASEFVGAIPSGGGIHKALWKTGGAIARKLPFIGSEALPQSAGFGERFVRFARNIGLSGAEGIAHMFGWRAGHGMSANAIERLKEAAVGRNALLEYGIAGGGGVVLPMAGRAYTGIRNMIQNLAQRKGGREALGITRVAENFLRSVPKYKKMGISEDVIWQELHNASVVEGKAIADAVAQTTRNLDRMLLTGEAPSLQALPTSRDLAWAAGRDPEAAVLRARERITDAAGVNKRMQNMLLATRGGLLTDPRTALASIVEDYANRATSFYRDLGRRSTVLDREVFRNFFKPKGKWEARTGNNRNTIDKAWDDTIEQIDNTLKEGDAAVADYAARYGREPERLATRKEFLDNWYIRDSRESKALIDSGEYKRARDTSGKELPRQSYVDDAGVTRYNHVLTKTNNTINPLHAQLIELNMYKYAKFKDPSTTTSPALTSLEQRPILAQTKAWNEAIGDALPAYKIGNKIHNEKKLIEEAYEAGKVPGVSKDDASGYDMFHNWLDAWKKTGAKLDVTSTAYNDAMRVFFSRSLKDFLPPNTAPEEILQSPELQQRLRRYIGRDDAYEDFMRQLMDEQAKIDVTRALPAPVHQLAGTKGTTAEMMLSDPSLIEQAPSAAAKAAFSLPFYLGGKGAEVISKLRGLSNEQVAATLINRMLSVDRPTKIQFVRDLQNRVAQLRSPIESGMEATYATGPLAVQASQGGEQYAVPERDRKKELDAYLQWLKDMEAIPHIPPFSGLLQ